MTHPVDAGKAMDIVYLHYSKAFDTASQCLLGEELAGQLGPWSGGE